MIKEFIDKPRKNEQVLISILWKNPNNYRSLQSHKFTEKSFVDKSTYTYFTVGKLMFEYGITNFERVTVYTFLDKRNELKTLFEDAGGYDVIENVVKTITQEDVDNLEYHANEILKFQALRFLYEKGLISGENSKTLQVLLDKNIDEVKMFFTHQLNSSLSQFNSSNYEIKDLIDESLYDTINDLKKGIEGSIPFYNSSTLNKLTKGWQRGKLYYLEMPSGLGKSTFSRNIFLPSIIENQENSLIFVNEESIDTWRVNLLITIVNTKIKEGVIFKDNVTSGTLKEEDEALLRKAADWLIEHQKDFIIKIIALKTYKFTDVIKIIENYAPYNITTCIIDTFKPDTNSSSFNKSRWESFSENAQELYDVIKKENMNIRCLATVQLKLDAGKSSYLGLENTGKSKEIVEVADVVMQGRQVLADEYTGEANQIYVYKYKLNKDYEEDLLNQEEENPDEDYGFGDKNNQKDKDDDDNKKKTSKWNKVSVELDKDKTYIILFFGKNRDGAVNKQILYEVDYQKNLIYEIGFTEMKPTSNEY